MNGFFFTSKKHPHLRMNKWGVVLAPKGHPDCCDWWGGEWTPLRNGLLDLQFEVEVEARAEGYTYKFVRGEILYSKPTYRQLPVEEIQHARV